MTEAPTTVGDNGLYLLITRVFRLWFTKPGVGKNPKAQVENVEKSKIIKGSQRNMDKLDVMASTLEGKPNGNSLNLQFNLWHNTLNFNVNLQFNLWHNIDCALVGL